MSKKRTPLPCTPENCGDLFPKCGKKNTYSRLKCRCDSCYEANAEYMKQYKETHRETLAKKNKQWREANHEVLTEKSKQYYAENREAISERKKQYYYENFDSIREQQKQYRAENSETLAEYMKQYRAENSEAIRAEKKRYHAERREAIVERNRQWRLANPERAKESGRRGSQRRRAKVKAVTVIDFTPEQLEQKMAYYGNACYLQIPGVCTGGFDHVDHVKPIAKDGPHMIANFRPACEPCNKRKSDQWPFAA